MEDWRLTNRHVGVRPLASTPEGISVLSGHLVLVLCSPGNECSLWDCRRASLAAGWQRRGQRRGAVRTSSYPKAKALGHTKPLLLSVPSGRAAHRGGERRSPDTHEEVGLCTVGDPSTLVPVEHWNGADSYLQSSHLQIHPRDHVQVTCPGPPPRQWQSTARHQDEGTSATTGFLSPWAWPLLRTPSGRWAWRRLCLCLKLLHPLCFLPPLWQMSKWHHCLKPLHLLRPLPLPLQTHSCSSPEEVSDTLLAFASQKTWMNPGKNFYNTVTHKKDLIVNQIPLSFRKTDLTSLDLVANTPGLRALRSEHNQIDKLCPPSEFSWLVLSTKFQNIIGQLPTGAATRDSLGTVVTHCLLGFLITLGYCVSAQESKNEREGDGAQSALFK